MPTPHRAHLVGCPTPGSAFVLESRLLKAYAAQLPALTRRVAHIEALCLAAFGPAVDRYNRPLSEAAADRQTANRLERLTDVVPELLRMLLPHEQQAVAPLLLEANDLAAFAKAVMAYNGAGNALYNREPEPKLSDARTFDVAAKVLGFGKLAQAGTAQATAASRQLRGLLPTGGPPLVLVPPTQAKPGRLRTAKRRRGVHPLTLPGQLCFMWPPVSAARALEAGL
ncbi:hypothetical protein [Hymenobacter properus]|uniref:Uncharacterized protein n=1 Tax=Hymenobacter properus TaxID=2791026 RepID=A0A931BBR2_9BACT|nr:hypothetical protein [Hymenobacter properus]MBF9140829.1 hypothetical protein [Hymenobacter properus]MBR7719638.1 hypothetical protein [Microvirga sp. SRT04]